jgi:hypothetical protein
MMYLREEKTAQDPKASEHSKKLDAHIQEQDQDLYCVLSYFAVDSMAKITTVPSLNQCIDHPLGSLRNI